MADLHNAVSLRQKIAQEIKLMLTFNKSERPWHLPFVAGLCVGFPVLLGAYFGRFDYGILGSLGGLVFLYLPQGALAQRMVTLVVCSFGFTVCFTLSLLASFNFWFSAFVLGITGLLIAFICRFYVIPPPGRFFFILVASIASTLPFDLAQVPFQVGVLALGGMSTCLLAFVYSLLVPAKVLGNQSNQSQKRVMKTESVKVETPKDIPVMIKESIVFGVFVGSSLLLAHFLQLDNPYWVPISCAAIMQGHSFQMVWHRKIHRIVGTAIGMGVAWGILSMSFNDMQLGGVIIVLIFLIESLVVRNYGLAVIFITPMTVLFAEVATNTLAPDQLVLIRMFDIALGSLIGLVGGWVLHHPQLRKGKILK